MFFRKRDVSHEFVNALLDCRFEAPECFDVRRDVPLFELQRWTSVEHHSVHPGARALKQLLCKGPSFKALVPLCKIGAISNSQSNRIMHLDSLPETMRLGRGESYGPLPEEELDRLRNAVFDEFSVRNECFGLYLQEWDRLYIAPNSGAARRFALWRRLTHDRDIDLPSVVTPYSLEQGSLAVLREEYRTVLIKPDNALQLLLYGASDATSHFSYLQPSVPSGWAMLLVPYPHMLPKAHRPLLLALHRRLEPLFDLGRYLTERISSRGGEPLF